MHCMKQVLAACTFIFFISVCTQGQGWRGVVPLRTDCEAVKRLLQIGQCRSATYQMSEETVAISFSDGTCNTGWKVAPGTVLSVTVHSRTSRRLTDTFPDLTKFTKKSDGHVRSVTYYENLNDGLSIAVLEDQTIAYVAYGPSLKDSSLQCPRNIYTPPPASIKFDEFGLLTKRDEELRVNNFAFELNAWPAVDGYIVAYTGEQRAVDGLIRAARIKDYLIKRRIPETRLKIINAGIRKVSTIELYLVIK